MYEFLLQGFVSHLVQHSNPVDSIGKRVLSSPRRSNNRLYIDISYKLLEQDKQAGHVHAMYEWVLWHSWA